MNDFSVKTAVLGVVRGLGDMLTVFVPRAVTAIVVFLVGLLLAKLAAAGIRSLFARFHIDDLLARLGLTELLGKAGLTGRPGELLARAVYYLLVLLFAQSAAQAVGLTAVSGAIGAFFAYLPNIVAAVVVLAIGVLAGRFLGDTVTRAARDAGVEFAPVLGRSLSTLVVFIVAVMAVSQLRIDTDLVKAVVLVLLAGMALALSFGLGTRDITRNLVAGFYIRRLLEVGDRVTVAGEEGELVGVTPLQTVLDREGRSVVLPNAVFLEQVAHQQEGPTDEQG